MRPMKQSALRVALAVAALFAASQTVSAQTPPPEANGHHAGMMGMHKGDMNPEMMHGLAGTMTQMHQMMEKMAGTMEQGQGMNTKAMSKMMDDMAGMMKNMATRMRDGRMDQPMLKRMNERMDGMGRSMKSMSDRPMMGKDGHQDHDHETKK